MARCDQIGLVSGGAAQLGPLGLGHDNGMTAGLSGDDLGAVGEALFATLAARAGLIANKSDRDRTGWDFVVEFPMPAPNAAVPLDARSPTACVVQIKATAGRDPVSLRLSAVERLAKDLRPSLLLVLRLTTDGAPLAGHAIHFVEAPLARVLKRLRIAQASLKLDVNRAKISFDHRRMGAAFELTPQGLRDALAKACGYDPAAYTVEKVRQLDELGYEKGRVEAEAVFRVDGIDHLNDILLGIKPFRPEKLTAFNTRFDVRLPYEGPGYDDVEEILIEPPTFGACTVSIRGGGLAPAALFDAEIAHGTPLVVPDRTWMLVRHPDFVLKFKKDAVAFSSVTSFETTARSLERWIPFLRGLVHLTSGAGEIVVTPEAFPDAPLRLPLAEKLDGPYLEQLPDILARLDGWSRLLELAGLKSASPFNLNDLFEARKAALAVDLCGSGTKASFGFDMEDTATMGERIDAVYVDTCGLGGVELSYSIKMTLERSQRRPETFGTTGFELLDVRPAAIDLQDYADEMAKRHELAVIIHPDNVTEADDQDW